MRDITERSRRASSCAYGRAASAASCARLSRAAATNFIARVICWLLFTERMRRRKSRSVAIGSVAARLLGGRLRYRGGETLLEFTDGFFDFGSDAVVESFFLGNIFQDGRGAGFDVFQHFLLETSHFVDGNVVEQAARGDENTQHLLF